MNDMELNLIPLWELVIERNFLTHITYNLKDDKNSINFKSFTKSLLRFVPTVSPYYCNSSENNKGFLSEFLMEAFKHSMDSIAVENPKLYLEWSSDNVKIQDSDEIFNKVFIHDIYIYIFILFILNKFLFNIVILGNVFI